MNIDYAERFREVSPLDWARLAAFIDGEGAICIKAFKQYGGVRHQVIIQITNTDEALPCWLSKTFETGHVSLRKRVGKWSPSYDWTVRGRCAIQMLRECLQYFVIKRDQAELAIRFDSLGQFRCGQGIHIPREIVQQRDVLKLELHALKKRGRFDEFKSVDKQEIKHYA